MRDVSIRHARIEELLFEELETILSFEVEDPRLENCRLTRVCLSPDFKLCRAFIVESEPRRPRGEVLEAIQHAGPFIRSRVAFGLGLKTTPKIEFLYDETFETVQRMEKIIERIHQGEKLPRDSEEEC